MQYVECMFLVSLVHILGVFLLSGTPLNMWIRTVNGDIQWSVVE